MGKKTFNLQKESKRLKRILHKGQIKKVLKKYKCPNNNLFIAALITLILFLFIELLVRIYNLYMSISYIDIVSHIFAGIALATGILWVLSLTSIQRKNSATMWFTFLGAGIWELFETLEELVIDNPPLMRDIFFWDGVGDIITTVIGGLFALWIIHILKDKTHLFEGEKI